MRLLFKQRLFSWFDSYDIYDEAGNTVYTVEGKLSWGHCLHILNAAGEHIGTVQERVLTFLPRFELYIRDQYVGSIQKRFTFFTPKFDIDCNGWQAEGDLLEWDYRVTEACGALGARAGVQGVCFFRLRVGGRRSGAAGLRRTPSPGAPG